MKKFAIPALAAAMALGACAEANAPEADAADDTADTTIVTPTATETQMVEVPADADPDGSSVTIDGGDVDATVSEDGVQADIQVD